MKKILLLITILIFSIKSYAVTQKIEVLGMVCAFCAQGIEKSFKSNKDVNDIFVSLENYFVAIDTKSEIGLKESIIINIITEAGYTVNKIEIVSESLKDIKIKYGIK